MYTIIIIEKRIVNSNLNNVKSYDASRCEVRNLMTGKVIKFEGIENARRFLAETEACKAW